MPNRLLHTPELITPYAIVMNFLYIPLILFINNFAEQLIVLGLFMAVDFISGLAKSFKVHEKFSYHRALAGILTKFFTLTIPFLLNFLSRGVGQYDEQISSILPWGLSALILIEFYSILGNFYTLNTGKELEDKDLLSFFILKIRKVIEAFIQAFKS